LTPGVLLVICGLASWAFATSLGHRAGAVPDLVVNSGVQMLTAGLVTGIATLVFGPAPASVIPTIDPEAWLSLAYLAVCGSLAFAAYTHLIHNEPAIRVVSYAFVNPLIAMVFGLVISNETATPYLVPGALMILGGLALMLWGERLFGVRADPPAGE
ncbi:MAG TPA: EamA family transporter, partial [Spirochaetota bacterium]|nr:EamA family transporter [Spirochaetota bacterium]